MRKWWIGIFVGVLGLVFGLSGGVARAAAPATKLSDLIAATNGYGTYVLSDLANLRSGPTANVGLNCSAAAPVARTNTGATLKVPVVGSVGAVETTTNTSATSAAKTARATSTTAGIDLLGGLIKSSAVSATSSVTVTAAGATTLSGSASLAGLRVGGVAVAANPAPNTTVSLRVGSTVIGKVVLNEQGGRSSSAWAGSITTRALSVYITAGNTLGLPIGTRIIVGNTSSALKAAPAGIVGGEGFAVRGKLADGAVKAGPHVYAAARCMGGEGTGSATAVDVPGLARVGAAKTDTSTTLGVSSRSSVKTSLTGVNLLGGLISADAVTANTSTTRAAVGLPVQTTDTSRVANLRVAGIPLIDGDVAPNTVVRIPGVATVTLHKVARTANGIAVTMLEIKLEKLLGALPTGSILEVGYSRTHVS